MENEIRVISVEGMTCDHCVNRISSALQELNGIENVMIDLNEAKVTVEFHPDKINLKIIRETIEDQGYDVK